MNLLIAYHRMRQFFVKFRKILPFLLIVAAVIILYYSVLFTYFSQDDFFHFKVSLTDGSFGQFINLFGFHPFSERGIAFYRPLFREAVFNIFYFLFGLNHYPFRIMQLILLFLNSMLIYYLITGILHNKYFSLFVAFFYSISAAQVAPLYYLAGGIQVLGATSFMLSCLISWNKYLTSGQNGFKILSLLLFIAGLGTHELFTTTIFMMLGLSLMTIGLKKTLTQFKFFLILGITLIIYLYLEVNVIGYSQSEQQYHPNLNLKTILNSYFWYTSWAMGLPEMLIDFVYPGFKLNPTLMRYWGNYYQIIFLSFFVSVLLILSSVFYLLFKLGKKAISRELVFFLAVFLISLLPVIFLPLHKSTQYLEVGLFAFWTAVGLVIATTYNLLRQKKLLAKIYLCFIIVNLLTLSVTSILLQKDTYWAAKRGKFAKQLIDQVISTYPKLPKGAIIYFENDPDYPYVANEWGSSSKQASLILNNQDALRLIYNDPTLQVFYEDLNKPSFQISETSIYKIKAKIF